MAFRLLVKLMLADTTKTGEKFALYLVLGQWLGFVHPDVASTEATSAEAAMFDLRVPIH